MGVYLHAKFQVSSVILKSFRGFRRGGEGGVILPPSPSCTSNRTPKKPTQIRVKGYENENKVTLLSFRNYMEIFCR